MRPGTVIHACILLIKGSSSQLYIRTAFAVLRLEVYCCWLPCSDLPFLAHSMADPCVTAWRFCRSSFILRSLFKSASASARHACWVCTLSGVIGPDRAHSVDLP